MVKTLAISMILVASTLAGCASPAERAVETCGALGLPENMIASCRIRMAAQFEAEDDAGYARSAAIIAAGGAATGAIYSGQYIPRY